jgi:hypothetical protein
LETEGRDNKSHLFLVRLWPERENKGEVSDGQARWQGKIQHVITGKAYYFHNWESMLQVLNSMLPHDGSVQPAMPDQPEAAGEPFPL